jgi:hypothetical protein
MPDDTREDTTNYRYTTVSTRRIGQQTKEDWKVKIKFCGNANNDLNAEGWSLDKASARTLLVKV